MVSFTSKRSNDSDSKPNKEDIEEENPGKIDMDEVSDNSSISLDLGYGLISMVDSNDKKSAGPLISKITGIRRQVSKDLGFIIPSVRITDDLNLGAKEYHGKRIVGHLT